MSQLDGNRIMFPTHRRKAALRKRKRNQRARRGRTVTSGKGRRYA